MLQLTSTITENATIEIGLRDIEVPKPGVDEVLIEVQASPINPSDLGTLVGAGDLTSIRVEGEGDQAKVIMDIPESVMWAMKLELVSLFLLVMKVQELLQTLAKMLNI